MKKISLIIILLLLVSCSSRKVIIKNVETKKDSLVETKVEVVIKEVEEKVDSINIVLTNENTELIITPIDTTKEIVVEGKTYKNVIISIKKNNSKTLYSNKKKESNIKSKDSIINSKVNKTENIKAKQKKIDKKQNNSLLLYISILIIILYILWLNKIRLFNVL